MIETFLAILLSTIKIVYLEKQVKVNTMSIKAWPTVVAEEITDMALGSSGPAEQRPTIPILTGLCARDSVS